MTPGKFLRLVWPSSGFYCIAHPYKPGDMPNVHRVFPTISEAVTHCHELMHTTDTFFAVLTLAQAEVPHPTKTNDDGTPKRATRLATNMLASRAVFFDLDVAANDVKKYPTQRDALLALATFLQATGLPMPTLNSSGGGIHVYWHWAEDVPAAEWREIAWHMRQLAEGLKLLVDRTRTIDGTSVLRVPGTFNWKDRANPREVKNIQEGVVTPIAEFQRLLSDAMIRHGVVATPAPERVASAPAPAAPLPPGLEAQSFDDFPATTVAELGETCAQVREMVRSQVDPTHPNYGQLDNPAWYRGLIGTLAHASDGDELARKLTAMHPRSVSDVDAKLQQQKAFPPARCASLREHLPWGDSPCKTCPAFTDARIPNPFVAVRRLRSLPPPGAEAPKPSPPPAPPAPGAPPPPLAALVTPSMNLTSMLIPPPPKPYQRVQEGITITRTDKDGNSTTSNIYPYDLYPLKRLRNADAGVEQHVWRVVLPLEGSRDFTLDADALYDGRKFSSAIANNGLFPDKGNLQPLQDYMVAYISQLQKSLDAEAQASVLGWSDDYRQFVLPDKTLLRDGSVRASAITEAARKSTTEVRKRGDVGKQVQLLGFYDRPEYIPNQFVILSSLASVLFHMTGNHGVVINMSGDSGASKSTTLYTCASLWGHTKLWAINGTQRGATANARSQRMVVNGPLPTCVDEVTNMPARDVTDMVMSVSQPGQRLRLSTDGSERQAGGGADIVRSAMMISSANSSLHNLLSADNAAGTAGSMRVFEIRMSPQRVHTKADADEFLRQLEDNFGWIGELFVAFVIKHYDQVAARVHTVMREIDARAHIASSERFWSGTIAAVQVAGEIARALRLVSYDVDAIVNWAVVTQVPYMRGVVKEEYRDPLAILTDYIAEKHGNILMVNHSTTIGANTSGQHVAADTAYADNNVNGALLGHFDTKAGVLYLLKQAFKEHCQRIGASSTRILDELNQPRPLPHQPPRRLVVDKNIRVTLGRGTKHAKGQVYCFAVDMNHPDVAGARPVLVASNDSAAA